MDISFMDAMRNFVNPQLQKFRSAVKKECNFCKDINNIVMVDTYIFKIQYIISLQLLMKLRLLPILIII